MFFRNSSLKIILGFMKNLAPNKMTFQTENSWMVQCLSLATVGMLAYMHIAPVVMAAA